MHAERITLDEALPLRRAHLRPPGHPIEPPKPGDLDPRAVHFGVKEEARLVAVATIHPTEVPGQWQLRAVAAEGRGQGRGRAVVEACVEHARAQGARLVWCHGRVGARGFYERLGFVAVGEMYEVPLSGAHFRMELLLSSR